MNKWGRVESCAHSPGKLIKRLVAGPCLEKILSPIIIETEEQ